MSEPRRNPIESSAARKHGPSAEVIAFRPRDAPGLPHDSQPETPAPRAARFEHNAGSLHAPAPRATATIAAVLAVACAIAGVVVALSLVAPEATTTQVRDVELPAWHVGWGAVPRKSRSE